MKKRLLSCLLSFALIFSLLPATVFAAEPCLKVSATSIKAGDEVKVTYTVPNEVTPCSVSLEIYFETAYFQVESIVPATIANASSSTSDPATSNTIGKVTMSALNMVGDPFAIPAGTVLVTIVFKAQAGVSGSASFTVGTAAAILTDEASNSLDAVAGLDNTPVSVSVLKAPIADASAITAKVADPVIGVTLDTAVDLGGATAYVGAVEWYKGESAVGTPVTGPAAAEQIYTAKITLTAKTADGESFDASLDGKKTTEGYKIEFIDAGKLELTKTFAATVLPMQDVSFADAGPIAKTFGDSNFTNAASNATAGGGAITYSGNNNAVATVNVSTGEVTIVGAGTVTVTATAAATATHGETTASYVLNVSAMTVVPNVTLAAGPFYYDGNPKTPAVTVDVSGVTLMPDKDYTVRYEGNTAVGTGAKAIVTAKDGSNYTWTPAVEKTFTIDKGTLDMSSAAWTTPAAFSYDGNAHTVEVTGLPAGVTVSGYTGNEATYVGSYTAAATLNYDTANYDLSAPLAPYAWSITAVEDPAMIAPAASVFKGKNIELSGNVSGAMGDVSYSITAPLAGCSVNAATGAFTAGTMPGNCTVTVTVAPKDVGGDSTPEYTGKTGTITVTVQNKTDVSANITFPDGTLEYTGGALQYENAEISGITPGANPMWTYVYTAGTGTLDGGLPKTVGTYTVQATYDDDDNNGVKTAALTVSPKKITAPAADMTVYTYDGTAKTYQIAASADYSVSGNVETNANETGYTVTVALTDKTNTVWADSMDATDKTYTFIIKQAVPTGEPKYTPIIISGKTLADAALTDVGGSFSVPGTVQWVADDGVTPLADTTEVTANTDYKWLFTPADAANYTTITGTIRLYSKSTGGSSRPTRYTVTFVSNGGSKVSSREVYRNDTVSEPTAPTKAGYDFDGWYTDKALTEKYDFSTKVKSSFKLYAKWTEQDNTANQIILTIDQKDAVVFGKKVTNDVAPKIVNDRTMLPARFVAENLGATVFWDGDKSLVTIIGKNEKDETVTISFVIGASVATVNGVEVKFDTPAFIENNRTYTPIRFISERLGAKVDWIAAERKAVITRATPAEQK